MSIRLPLCPIKPPQIDLPPVPLKRLQLARTSKWATKLVDPAALLRSYKTICVLNPMGYADMGDRARRAAALAHLRHPIKTPAHSATGNREAR